jgi:hypothetical protein
METVLRRSVSYHCFAQAGNVIFSDRFHPKQGKGVSFGFFF